MVSISVVVGIFRGYFDLFVLPLRLCASADEAKGGDGAKSALREILTSLVAACRKLSYGRHIKI